jgi:hypothetical protein
MNAWLWVAIGLAAWFGLALAAGSLLGRALRGATSAREALEAQLGQAPPERDKPPQDGPHAA